MAGEERGSRRASDDGAEPTNGKAVGDGSNEGFGARICSLRGRVSRVLSAKEATAADREDAEQQTMVELVRRPERLGKLREKELKAYASCAAVGALRKAHRTSWRWARREGEWAQCQDAEVHGADVLLTRAEEALLARHSLDALPEKLSVVVVARIMDGLGPKKASETLGLSRAAVRSRLRKALRVLRVRYAR